MAKTVFEHGTIVTPEFLNKINNQTNTGTANDGDAPKVRFQDVDGFVQDSFNIAFSGFTGGYRLVNVKYSILYPFNVGTMGLVFLWFDEEIHAPDAAIDTLHTMGNTGYEAIPEILRPINIVRCPVRLVSGGFENCPGSLEIRTEGYLQFIRDDIVIADNEIRPNVSFPTTGSRGWNQQVIHYPINLV